MQNGTIKTRNIFFDNFSAKGRICDYFLCNQKALFGINTKHIRRDAPLHYHLPGGIQKYSIQKIKMHTGQFHPYMLNKV